MTDPINSDSYWNRRFSNDWDTNEGPEQSVFFAHLLLRNLPSWFIDYTKKQTSTAADWGCAEGQGTEYWASRLTATRFLGIDFSDIAITKASAQAKLANFACENWLGEGFSRPDRFDFVFSSNTLEHFEDPLPVLNNIARHASKAVVLALPYKEMERIDEHFHTFLPDNLPTRLSNGFRLVWSRVANCDEISHSYWNGKQIFLIYAETSWVDGVAPHLQDCTVQEEVFDPQKLAEMHERVAALSEDREKWREQALEMSNWGSKLNDFIAVQSDQLARVSQRLQAIEGAPLRYVSRRYARGAARRIFNALPLPAGPKQFLRRLIGRILRRVQVSAPAAPSGYEPERVQRFIAANPKAEANPVRDVLVFSVIDWHFRIQRPQQIARGFAQNGARVFFLSNHFVDDPEPGYEIERLDVDLELYQVKLHVSGAPAIYFSAPGEAELDRLRASLAKLLLDQAALSTVSVVEHAYWYPLARSVPNSLLVYDCMDHHEGFGNVPRELIDLEHKMMASSDLVVTTSSWLEDMARGKARSLATVRNACEYERFAKAPQQVYQDARKRKIIGYYGAIAEWFDLDLVRRLASENPDALVLLVGNDTAQAGAALKGLFNVVMTGEVPYDQLTHYLYAFDVCLLPFKVIPLTLATNPVKVYEYLAAGKPVVSTELPEIAQFGELVDSASSHDQFAEMVKKRIAVPSSPAEVEQRRAFAQRQTWQHRAEEFSTALAGLSMPRISVIVLTYNNLELTKACLDSLITRSHYPNLEIIVVDNASTDGSVAYLTAFGKTYPEVKIILNETNVGFAAGNNIGLAAATGQYLTLFNNDTIATRGWALTMMRHLQQDTSVGLVGPVTNNIGNEAKIRTTYTDPAEMPQEAAFYTLRRMGRAFPLKTAAFFCVMMPRSTYEKCGPLCEEYGLGFFEDDDYCRRVEQQGLRVLCVRDVFIHHHLSASFNKMLSKDRQALVDRNRAIYESKWGPWEPHQYDISNDDA